jgi:hypothetical protein
MKKLYLFASLLALCAGTAAMLPGARPSASLFVGGNSADKSSFGGDSSRHDSGAYRDGLYLGRFTAERGSPRHVVSGRWATTDNRALFAAGYEQGYGESAATRALAALGEGNSE